MLYSIWLFFCRSRFRNSWSFIGWKRKENVGRKSELYDGYGQLNAGYIMSIIGTALSGLYIVYWVIVVAILGETAFSLRHMH